VKVDGGAGGAADAAAAADVLGIAASGEDRLCFTSAAAGGASVGAGMVVNGDGRGGGGVWSDKAGVGRALEGMVRVNG
jgi:hypothetical protein